MMESPDEASAMACPIVLQAVVGDLQLLPSLSLTPFTYLVCWRMPLRRDLVTQKHKQQTAQCDFPVRGDLDFHRCCLPFPSASWTPIGVSRQLPGVPLSLLLVDWNCSYFRSRK